MQVILQVRIIMMMAMMSGPPEDAFLSGRRAYPGHDELKGSAGLVRAMGEISMVATSDGPHANEIQENAEDDGGAIHSGPNRSETGEMEPQKNNAVYMSPEMTLLFSLRQIQIR